MLSGSRESATRATAPVQPTTATTQHEATARRIAGARDAKSEHRRDGGDCDASRAEARATDHGAIVLHGSCARHTLAHCTYAHPDTFACARTHTHLLRPCCMPVHTQIQMPTFGVYLANPILSLVDTAVVGLSVWRCRRSMGNEHRTDGWCCVSVLLREQSPRPAGCRPAGHGRCTDDAECQEAHGGLAFCHANSCRGKELPAICWAHVNDIHGEDCFLESDNTSSGSCWHTRPGCAPGIICALCDHLIICALSDIWASCQHS